MPASRSACGATRDGFTRKTRAAGFNGIAAIILGGAGFAEGMTTGGQFQAQLIGVIAVLLWTALISFVILKVTGLLVGLRVSSEQEAQGLDIHRHDEKGYNL